MGARWDETRAAEWLHHPLEANITNSAVYYFRCLGGAGGSAWLDGRTPANESSVGLAPSTVYPYTGTRWRAHRIAPDVWAFRCLGDAPGNRWLDGRTSDGTVGLVEGASAALSGRHWEPIRVRDGVFLLKCRGAVEGNRFLDGRTAEGSVGLAPHANSPFTGTHWELRRERWWVGCNFIPSTAVNQLEMWQAETFDLQTIDKELAWAARLGFNAVRVFLHDLLWTDARFTERMDRYLDCAAKHGIFTLLVFFDDCWGHKVPPRPGPQAPPKPGLHNSQWLQSPGDRVTEAPAGWTRLRAYVQGVITAFGDDARILGWDLYNEPGGGEEPPGTLPGEPYDTCWRAEVTKHLVMAVFDWARDVDPSQPLTSGVFSKHHSCTLMRELQFDRSDIVSFHAYRQPWDQESVGANIVDLRPRRRPLLCTEYVARTEGSRFERDMPLLNEHGVGAFHWGLVAGKTQTYIHWDEVKWEWHHDVLKSDGAPYSDAEAAIIKCITGKEPAGLGIEHNAVYQFRCAVPGDGLRWLDGETATGRVRLDIQREFPFTGTRWRAVREMEGVYAFECLGTIPGNRWLDGRTHDGSVGLAAELGPSNSGARWQLCRVRDLDGGVGVYLFRCLGEVDGHDGKRLLDGNTLNAIVSLAPHCGREEPPKPGESPTPPGYIGTRWEVFKIADPPAHG